MEVQLSYNDLKLFLTKEDREQIKAMPMPSLTQAKEMKKRWDSFFGENLIKKTPEAMQNGIIHLKPYMKVFNEYPEIFV